MAYPLAKKEATPEETQEKIRQFASQIGPAAMGAGNAALFGLPEAGTKFALDLMKDEKTKQAIEDWKKANSGYGDGEVAGTFGSMLIPGGALAKGASAVLGGTSKGAQALARLGELAAGKASMKQGLAASAEQAVPRALADIADSEGDLTKTGQNVAMGLGAGGALGGLGGLAGRLMKSLPARPVEELQESIDNQYLNQLFGKNLTRPMRQVLKNQKSIKQGEQFVNAKSELVKKLDERGIRNAQQAEDLLTEEQGAWPIIAQHMNEAHANGTAPMLGDAPNELFEHQDVLQAMHDYPDDALPAIIKITQEIKNKTMAPGPSNVFYDTRKTLNDYIEHGYKSTDLSDRRVGETAQALKNYYDELATKVAQAADPSSKSLADMKELYPYLMMMGRAIGREKSMIAPAFQPGSATFNKFMVDASKDLGSVLASTGKGIAGEALSRVATAGANALGTEAGLGIKKIWPKNIEGNMGEISQAFPKINAALGLGQKAVGAGLEKSGVGIGEMNATKPTQQIPMMQPMPTTGAITEQKSPLDSAIERAWSQSVDPTGEFEGSTPGSRQEFITGIKSRLIDKSTGQINYKKASTILFPDPDERKVFESGLSVYNALKREADEAFDLTPKLGDADKAHKLSVEVVQNALQDALTKGDTKISAKTAEEMINGIFNSLDDPETKKIKAYSMIEKVNPKALNYLRKVGVMQ